MVGGSSTSKIEVTSKPQLGEVTSNDSNLKSPARLAMPPRGALFFRVAEGLPSRFFRQNRKYPQVYYSLTR